MPSIYSGSQSLWMALRSSLKFNLEKIKTSDGFNSSLGDYFDDPPQNLNQIQNFPAIVTVFKEEKAVAESNDTVSCVLPISLYVHVMEGSSPSLLISQIKADIQYIIGNYWQLPNENGVACCDLIQYVGALPFARINSLPQCGVLIKLQAEYRYLLHDPSSN